MTESLNFDICWIYFSEKEEDLEKQELARHA